MKHWITALSLLVIFLGLGYMNEQVQAVKLGFNLIEVDASFLTNSPALVSGEVVTRIESDLSWWE